MSIPAASDRLAPRHTDTLSRAIRQFRLHLADATVEVRIREPYATLARQSEPISPRPPGKTIDSRILALLLLASRPLEPTEDTSMTLLDQTQSESMTAHFPEA